LPLLIDNNFIMLTKEALLQIKVKGFILLDNMSGITYNVGYK